MAEFHAEQKVVCVRGVQRYLFEGNIYTIHQVNPEGYLIIREVSEKTGGWRWGWNADRFEPFPE